MQSLSSWVNYPLFQLGGQAFSLFLVVELLFWILVAIAIAKVSQMIAKKFLLPKLGFDVGNREAFSVLIAYLVGTLGIVIVLQNANLNLTSLAVVAGGLGIGIGFGLQSITKDFISGLILLLGRSIKVDDFVQFGERQEFASLQGTVQKISLLFTVIQTKDGGSLIVPNSYLVIFPILNWSYHNQQNRVKLLLRVNKDIDLVLFAETVLSAVHTESKNCHVSFPKLVFKNFGQNYCEFELQMWIDNIRDEDFIKNAINHAINYYLNEQDLTCSYSEEITLRSSAASFPILLQEKTFQNSHNIHSIYSQHGSQKKPLSVRALLKQVKYFETLSDLKIRQLIEVGYRQELAPSEVLFREGDAGDAFYIILSGSVEVYAEKIDKHLVTLNAGAFFGELALLLGIPRTASVKALELTLVFVINQKGFKKLLQENSDLAKVILKQLEQHREELQQRQQQLREMGLIDEEEDDNNLLTWVQKRLTRIFALS